MGGMEGERKEQKEKKLSQCEFKYDEIQWKQSKQNCNLHVLIHIKGKYSLLNVLSLQFGRID